MKVRVKICGITRKEDAIAAANCGADAIGMVFYPASPRHVEDMNLAREIAMSVGPFVNVVGLFVDAEPRNVRRVLSSVPLTNLQFHGSETEQYCRQFDMPYIKALRMRNDINIEEHMSAFSSAGGFLLDTYVKGTPGGTGKVFDWRRVPRVSQKPIIVAGGLDEGSVSEAIKQAKPYGVDVSGGVESEPGIKCQSKIAAFIAQASLEY